VQYPVVADPEGADFNQGYIQWQGTAGTRCAGPPAHRLRQRAVRRQTSLAPERADLRRRLVPAQGRGFDWQGAWVGQANRIFGRDVPDGRHDNNTWLLNASKSWEGLGKLAGYTTTSTTTKRRLFRRYPTACASRPT